MDQIKEAFDKVKADISSLSFELQDLKKEMLEIQNSIVYLIKIQEKLTNIQETQASTLRHITSTHNLENTTNNQTSTHNQTHNLPFQSLKHSNFNSSIGNEGVSTDRQTDRQTDNSTHFQPKINSNEQMQQNITSQQSSEIQQQPTTFQNQSTQQPPITKNPSITQQPQQPQSILISPQSSINNQEQSDPYLVLEQLDSIKKELRFKIKRLTNQEMLVLSTIYQYEDQGKVIDYSSLSQVLNLSESSIRDYITRIIAKKIPIVKEKYNNKKIIIHISPNLKKLASLNTLLSLREL